MLLKMQSKNCYFSHALMGWIQKSYTCGVVRCITIPQFQHLAAFQHDKSSFGPLTEWLGMETCSRIWFVWPAILNWKLLHVSHIDISIITPATHERLGILNQSPAVRLFGLPISQTNGKGMAKLVIIGPLWGGFGSGQWIPLTAGQ